MHQHIYDYDHLHAHEHILDHEDGHEHAHVPGNGHAHAHVHSHEQTQAVMNRLARAIGHLESVKKMVENGRDCSEVLVQLAAVQAALTAASRVILKEHIEHCIVHAAKTDNQEAIAELNRAIDHLF